jgi:hypothetical protein
MARSKARLRTKAKRRGLNEEYQSTKKAVTSVLSDVGIIGQPTSVGPKSRVSNVGPSGMQDNSRFTGSEEFWTLGTATTVGTAIMLDGAEFLRLGLRLSANFLIFDQWCINKMTLEFVPTVSLSTAGYVTIAYEPDVSDPLPASQAILAKIWRSVTVPCYQQARLDLTSLIKESGLGKLWCEPRRYPGGAGQLMVWHNAGASPGKLVLHYDLSFRKPQPSKPLAVAATSIISMVMSASSTAAGGYYRPSPVGITNGSVPLSLAASSTAYTATATAILLRANSVYRARATAFSNCELYSHTGNLAGPGSYLYFRRVGAAWTGALICIPSSASSGSNDITCLIDGPYFDVNCTLAGYLLSAGDALMGIELTDCVSLGY